MFVKDFKHLSSPTLNISIATPDGPLAFPIFIRFIAHRTSSTSILLTAPSTLLASMLSLHSFSTFINFSICSFQIFFRSSTLTFTAPLSSFRQLIPTTSLFSPALCLAILNNSRPSRLHFLPSFLIHCHIYYSLSIFFCLAIFLPIFLIPTLSPDRK